VSFNIPPAPGTANLPVYPAGIPVSTSLSGAGPNPFDARATVSSEFDRFVGSTFAQVVNTSTSGANDSVRAGSVAGMGDELTATAPGLGSGQLVVRVTASIYLDSNTDASADPGDTFTYFRFGIQDSDSRNGILPPSRACVLEVGASRPDGCGEGTVISAVDSGVESRSWIDMVVNANERFAVSAALVSSSSAALGFESNGAPSLGTRTSSTDSRVQLYIDVLTPGGTLSAGSSGHVYQSATTLPPTTPPIPEPSTWALMLAGLGLAGAVSARRPRR
jgi:hypothetical protein